LYLYGGCWLDVSIIINQSQALDEIYQQSLTHHYDITLFQSQAEKKNGPTFPAPKYLSLLIIGLFWHLKTVFVLVCG
jgi:hypothetical protein